MPGHRLPAQATSATSNQTGALPPHPTLSPRQAWGRGLDHRQPTTNDRQPGFLPRALFALFALFACAAKTASADEPPGSSLDVALYTFGPGEEIWERFGHNAIEVRDRATGVAHLYNYGIFDFGQKNFFLNFARGRMTYRIAAGDPAEELPVYVAEGRWIVRQELNLTPPQRLQLAQFLAWNALPENAQYRYDYFTDNCATRVRDALDAAVGGAIRAQTISPSRGFSYRMDADRLMQPELPVMLAMDAGLGPYADQRLSYWAESFVPMEFMRHVRDVQVRDESGNLRPLVASETLVAAARLPEPPAVAPDWLWRALGTGIALALALAALARLRRNTVARAAFAVAATTLAVVLGSAGVVLALLWAATDHVSAWRNENLLLFDPLCLLLVPCWLGAFRARWRPSAFAVRTAVAIAAGAALAWFIKVFPAFAHDNRFWIALLLPLHLAFVLILLRARESVPPVERTRD